MIVTRVCSRAPPGCAGWNTLALACSARNDRVFIRSLNQRSRDSSIVTATVSLAHALGIGLEVIAEGVENDPQVDYLRRLGCDAAQGYYYARPQPAGDLTTLLEGQLPRATARGDGRDSKAA